MRVLTISDHHHDDDHGDHDDHGGLHRDLAATGTAMDRRGMLRFAARFGVAFGAVQLIGCAADAATVAGADAGSTGTTGGTTGGATGAACPTKIPEETAGPFPGDSSNGPNVLNQTGVVRSDLRSSFAGLSGTAAGVLLNVELTIVSAASCSPLAGYAVYLWHCDRAGNYSLYSSGVTNQNYLRGVQAADADGKVKFTSIYPGCYSGRWPHIHFEVYQSLSAATAVRNKIATSQIALPKTASDLVYATSGYTASITNLSRISLASDMVFSDGASLELATVTGDVSNGMTAALTVAV
jgi:protocatechuate 3,4-dioxygenase beta subunit